MAGRLQGRRQGQETGPNRDANSLLSSPAWLRVNGLKASKLTLPQVLTQIGFRQREDYVASLGRSVCSQYARGLFTRVGKNGSVYNLTASPEQLEELCERLDQKARLFQHRLAWLTSGSRQIFGVIQERSAALVLDFGTASGGQFRLGQSSVCMVIKEQVSQIAWFNLIRPGPVAELWRGIAECTSPTNIDAAAAWVWGLGPAKSSPSYTADALLAAIGDPKLEAVYLFAVGDGKVDTARLLRTRRMKNAQAIHCVSFNAKRKETIKGLKELSHRTAGRFHAFAEMSLFEDVSHDSGEGDHGIASRQMSVMPIGGLPPGEAVREDVFLVWREMQDALTTRAEIQELLQELNATVTPQDPGGLATAVSEDCLSSKSWLSYNGLKVQNLSLYDALADCAFRHADGVEVAMAKLPDVEPKNKLVNAKYCSQFAHMTWVDGSVVHVYVTPEKSRWYRDRMEESLKKLQRRLEWLQQGSRQLFGAVLELQVYILIDTSEPMKEHLPLLKDKFYQLIQEQLSFKAKVNFVAFGSQVVSWRVRLTEVSEENLERAWSWVQGLQAGGSTNILEALQVALADIDTHAVYLLTHSGLDEPTGTILARVQSDRPVPIHTVSFNCSDPETNCFLVELSRKTGGRYHSHCSCSVDPAENMPFVSEDTHLLKEEIKQGKNDLKTVLRLRAECVMLDWYHNRGNKEAERSCRRPPAAPRPPGSAIRTPRPHLATPRGPSSQGRDPSPASQGTWQPAALREFLEHAADVEDGDGASSQDWSLPETQALFQKNVDKQNWVLDSLQATPTEGDRKRENGEEAALSLDVPTARWLQTNSLVARRLTIMDALAPTIIRQKAKYIPILDTNVHSKVFDEVSPLALGSSGSQRVVLLNPLAVDLEGYKARLQETLTTYKRRLESIFWNALSEEVKSKFGSEEPVVFTEHRDALLRTLEDLGCPLPRTDVDLLEEQVHLACSFLQQASDLQQTIKEKARDRHPDPGTRVDSRPAKDSGMKQRGVLDGLRGQSAIGRSETDGFYYTGTIRRYLSGKRVMMDFKSGQSEVVPLRFLIPIGGSGPRPPLATGDFVLVGSGNEGAGNCFVPGVVIATPCRLDAKDKLYTVFKFNDRKVHATRNKIIKISQARYNLTCRYIRECEGRHAGVSEDLHGADKSSEPKETRMAVTCSALERSNRLKITGHSQQEAPYPGERGEHE
ncbi:von Willebrand factor A domain-containing protein 3B-like [Brienomyrus brachyistius]|uniref:von Willebrand factor A domain-containing protein 3B-like n=1 Tax=Brienomyrus brachyistius TaxID=42636 RepID=UPI0020B18FAA|nr:von Willebrand factor A domain-containing protein 3B-like [Brienomyrus brachyistius]XP_048855370.1 von Willebrand factor A domain-containing protein 3B-like [Brienomyrus brachyistius]XP_048855371.1 von Willebrand factor A domain-containing protein 3B-like [Brienomyrus brachyistius]